MHKKVQFEILDNGYIITSLLVSMIKENRKYPLICPVLMVSSP